MAATLVNILQSTGLGVDEIRLQQGSPDQTALDDFQDHIAQVITVQSTGDGPANAANCPGANCRLRDALAAASDDAPLLGHNTGDDHIEQRRTVCE